VLRHDGAPVAEHTTLRPLPSMNIAPVLYEPTARITAVQPSTPPEQRHLWHHASEVRGVRKGQLQVGRHGESRALWHMPVTRRLSRCTIVSTRSSWCGL
jgi:hypothetical protein